MSETPAEVDTPVDADAETTDPYADTPVIDGVGVQDDEADQLDPFVGGPKDAA